MARTTLDIDDPILSQLRALHQEEGRSMGRVASQLLAEALAARRDHPEAAPLAWRSRPMRARVDLSDKEAVYAILDRDG